jgi:hypothetical protein
MIQYAIDHLRLNGQKIDLNFFETNFHQPFSQLPASCSAQDEEVRQVRICVEVLRSYLGRRPLSSPQLETKLVKAEQNYLLDAYTRLLTKLGTSFTEVRLARGMSNDERAEFANRIGVLPAAVSNLFLDPGAAPPQLTEAKLEQIFGLLDTNQAPIRTVPDSSIQTWRLSYLRDLWKQEDFPTDAYWDHRTPIIDPDLIGPDDFRNPFPKTVTHAPDRAFDLWLKRRVWVDGFVEGLKTVPARQSGSVTGPDFQAIVDAIGDYDYNGQAPQWPADALTKIEDKLAAITAETETSVSQELYDDYGLALSAARRLIELWEKDVAFWKDVNRYPRVEEAEWPEVFSILLKAQKVTLRDFWISEENESVLLRVAAGEITKVWSDDTQASQLLLGPMEFWAAIRKPTEGDWPPNRLQGVPLIDPQTVKRQDLPGSVAGARALAFWDNRSAELDGKRRELWTALKAGSFDDMVEKALGQPPTSVNSWSEYFRSLTADLIGSDQAEAGAAKQIIEEDFHLTLDEFRRMVRVMEIELSTTATTPPSTSDLEEVISLLCRSWKQRTRYATWYDEEIAPTSGVEAWRCARHSLTQWRASSEERQAWDSALQSRSAPPAIDPDILASSGYIKTPGSGNAWAIWESRRQSIANKFRSLQAMGGGGNRTVATLISATDAELGVGVLAELAAAMKAGQAIAARLQQLQLSYAMLNELLDVLDILNVAPPEPVLDSEWDAVSSILTQVWKQRRFAAWRLEERSKGIVLSQDFFQPLPIDLTQFPLPPGPKLDPWRASSTDLLDWLDKLQSRTDQEQEVISALKTAVSEVEEQTLPALRDALVEVAYPAGLTDAPAGRWLGDRLGIATEYRGCHITTRVAQAIETFQIILWGARTGLLADTFPNLRLVAPDFDEEWKWIGSYASWRSAMFVFLYPENLLLPSLLHFQTPGLQSLIDSLRNTPRLTLSAAREAAKTYDTYFRDICTLALAKDCLLSVTIDGVQRSLTFLFGVGGQTGSLYWSVSDSARPPEYRQSAWTRITATPSPFRLLDSFVYNVRGAHRYLYLFMITEREGTNELAFLRYDIAQYPAGDWPESITKLALPPNATIFSAEVVDRSESGETDPIRIRFRLDDGTFYERELTIDGDDWSPGSWNPTDRYWTPWISSEVGTGDFSANSRLAAIGDSLGGVLLFAVNKNGKLVRAHWLDIFYDPKKNIGQFTEIPAPTTPVPVAPGSPSRMGPPQFNAEAPVKAIWRPPDEEVIFATDRNGYFWEVSRDDTALSNWVWQQAGGIGYDQSFFKVVFTASQSISPAIVGLAPNNAKFRIFAPRDPDDEFNTYPNNPDNSYTSIWIRGQGWDQWRFTNYLSNDDSIGNWPTTFGMAGISRKRGHVDLFAVGIDQLLYMNSSEQEGAAFGDWKMVPNSIKIPIGSQIFIISESPEAMMIAIIDDNGLCQSITFDSNNTDNEGWSNWSQVGRSDVRLRSGSALTGFVVSDRRLVLLALGEDGLIYSNWKSQGHNDGGWHNWTQVGMDAPANIASFTAVTRSGHGQATQQILLFAVTESGEVIWTTSQENLGSNLGAYGPYSTPHVSDLDKLPIGENLSDAARQLRQSIIELAYAENWYLSKAVRAYLEEAFYFVPLHIALQLQKSGLFVSALDWFRLVYDFTAPIGQRRLLGLPADQGTADYKRKTETWLLDPLNPHAIAEARAKTYTRFTQLSIIQCLLDYADSEFTAGTSETVPMARELYERALGLLESGELHQSAAACDQIIGELEISVDDPHWEWLTGYVNSSLKELHDPSTVREAVAQIEALEVKTLPWSERFVAIQSVLSAAAPPGANGLTFENQIERSRAKRPELESAALSKQEVRAALDWSISDNSQISMLKQKPSLVPTSVFDFCVPPNPLLQTLSLRAKLNLYKIRNCRNIAGMEQHIEPFAAPTDTTSGLPVIGAGGQIVTAAPVQIQPTPYRYAVIIERAKQLAQQAVQFEAAFLGALEKRDREAFDLLNARANLRLAQAGVRLQDLRVTQARDEVKFAEMQRDRAGIQADTYDDWLNRGLTPSELSLMGWYDRLALSQIISVNLGALMQGITEGIAIGTSQALSFGATSGLQVAFQAANVGKAVADSLGVDAQRQINRLNILISYERNIREWSLQKSLADQDMRIGEQQILLANDGLGIMEQERAIEQMKTDQAKDALEFLTNKFTNKELYDWMSVILERVYSFFLQQATSMAQIAAAQLGFERQETPPRYIQDDYWEPPSNDSGSLNQQGSAPDRRGLTGSARLLQDIYQLDQYAFETNRRKQSLTKTLSLAQYDPLAFQQFLQTGVLPFTTSLELFDRDFPGHYLRLIKRVRTSVIALIPPPSGIRATLSVSGLSRVVSGGDVFQTTVVRRPPEVVALTAPMNATGVFDLQEQPEMLLPFEGHGVATSWEFALPKAANLFDYSTVADVLVTIDYTALSSFDYRLQVAQLLNARRSLSSDRAFSFRYQFADAWYDLHNPELTLTPMSVRVQTLQEDFPPNIDNIRIEHVSLYFSRRSGSNIEFETVDLRFAQSGGGLLGGVSRTDNGVISTRSGNGSSWLGMRGALPFGDWRLTLSDTEEIRQWFKNGDVIDILLIVTYSGRLQEWPI